MMNGESKGAAVAGRPKSARETMEIALVRSSRIAGAVREAGFGLLEARLGSGVSVAGLNKALVRGNAQCRLVKGVPLVVLVEGQRIGGRDCEAGHVLVMGKLTGELEKALQERQAEAVKQGEEPKTEHERLEQGVADVDKALRRPDTHCVAS